MNYGLSEKHLAIIHEILALHQTITHALLFGSRARGTFKPASDVDIALKGAITIKLIAKIKAEFEESNLPFFVDIVDYAKADNTLKGHIDAQGILLYIKDISHFSNARAINKDFTLTSKYDKSSPCHSGTPFCHSEALAEESQENTITLTQNQIAFSKYPAFTYILTNKNNTTLYIGVTGNLQKRIYEHKNHLAKGFSDKYNCEKLVYFESFDNINQAIEREKYLKGKKRDFKANLIHSINPKWLDLYDYLFSCHSELEHSESEESNQNRDVSASPQHDKEKMQHNTTNLHYPKDSPYHSKNLLCHSEPALAGEESLNMKSHRDISPMLNMTNGEVCHSNLDLCHSGALAEESQKSNCHSKTPSCHSERSEESNRDISLVSQAQYDNKGRK